MSDEALQDSVASLRMADGIIRDMAEAGAIGPPGFGPDDDFDVMLDLVLDLVRDGVAGCRLDDVTEVLRLTERRLEELTDLMDDGDEAARAMV